MRRHALLLLAALALGPGPGLLPGLRQVAAQTPPTPQLKPAPLDVNTAGRADLESLPGIGPALAERLLAARAQAPFSDWTDLRRRVHGIGPKLAARLSDQGLRVHGLAWAASPAGAAPVSAPTQSD